MKRKKQEPEYITKSGLKSKRGWTDKLISSFLKEPDKMADNPHYKIAAPMSLYLLTRIDEIEKRPEFIQMKGLASIRKKVAIRSVEVKRMRIMEYVKSLKISVPEFSQEDLVHKACTAYNQFKGGLALERGFEFEPATPDSEWDFLNRICINFLRHNCTRYEKELEGIYGKVGVDEAYKLLKERVNEAILSKYKFLSPIQEREYQTF